MSNKTFREKAVSLAGVILGSIFILVTLAVVITAAAAVNGLVIKIMWGWFVTPLGLPALGYAQAIGLGFLARYLTWQQQTPDQNDDDKEAKIRRMVVVFLYPFIVLGLGFVAHSFM